MFVRNLTDMGNPETNISKQQLPRMNYATVPFMKTKPINGKYTHSIIQIKHESEQEIYK